MKRFQARSLFRFMVLAAAFACAATWAASQVRSMRDRSEVAQMTEKMKTVCVGRYLVDVPAQAEVELSRGALDGFDVDSVEESETKFRQRIVAREVEIAAKSAEAGMSGPGGMIETRELHIPGMIGRTLVYGLTRTHGFENGHRVDTEFFSVEAHAHTQGVSFSLSLEFADKADVAEPEALLSRLRLQPMHELPDVPGFCVRHAVFAEPLPPHTSEHIAMHMTLPGHRDMALRLMSMPGGGSDPGLMARDVHMDASMSSGVLSRINKLRVGRRTVHGVDGEEVLQQAREFNSTTTYSFMWESRGLKNDPRQPYLTLELQTGISERPGGKPVDTSLHEDALLALWDSIASSIRLRNAKSSRQSGRSAALPSPAVQQLVAH
jgi:hypothetical protein